MTKVLALQENLPLLIFRILHKVMKMSQAVDTHTKINLFKRITKISNMSKEEMGFLLAFTE